MSLNGKVAVIIAIFSVACGGVAFECIRGLVGVHSRLDQLIGTVSARQSHWLELRDQQRLLTLREREIILESKSEDRKEKERELDESKTKIASELQSYLKIASVEGREAATRYSKLMVSWWKLHLKVRDRVSEGRTDEALALSAGEGRQLRNEAEAVIEDMVRVSAEAVADAHIQAREEYRSTIKSTLATAVLALTLAILSAWWLLRGTGQSVVRGIGDIEESIRELAENSQVVSVAFSGVSRDSGAQADSIARVAGSVEELSAKVETGAEAAQRTAHLSEVAQAMTVKGHGIIKEMARTVQEIDESNQLLMKQTEENNRQIAEITKVIGEIGHKTEVINDIVFQTRLLSFNASVEAARAGAQGRGFAVVAEEIGNLAQLSGNAAKEINAMLSSGAERVQAIVEQSRTQVEKLIQNGRRKVEAGAKIASDCESVLEEILGKTTEVSRMSSKISTMSQEQTRDVFAVRKAMVQLNEVARGNRAGADEAALSIERLEDQARSIDAAIGALARAIRGDDAERVERSFAPRSAPSPASISVSGSLLTHGQRLGQRKLVANVDAEPKVISRSVGRSAGRG